MEITNEAALMVSDEFVSLFKSSLMFSLTTSPCSLPLHAPQHDCISPTFASWPLRLSIHQRLSLCPIRSDLERRDLVGNWLENELAGLGLNKSVPELVARQFSRRDYEKHSQ